MRRMRLESVATMMTATDAVPGSCYSPWHLTMYASWSRRCPTSTMVHLLRMLQTHPLPSLFTSSSLCWRSRVSSTSPISGRSLGLLAVHCKTISCANKSGSIMTLFALCSGPVQQLRHHVRHMAWANLELRRHRRRHDRALAAEHSCNDLRM